MWVLQENLAEVLYSPVTISAPSLFVTLTRAASPSSMSAAVFCMWWITLKISRSISAQRCTARGVCACSVFLNSLHGQSKDRRCYIYSLNVWFSVSESVTIMSVLLLSRITWKLRPLWTHVDLESIDTLNHKKRVTFSAFLLKYIVCCHILMQIVFMKVMCVCVVQVLWSCKYTHWGGLERLRRDRVWIWGFRGT